MKNWIKIAATSSAAAVSLTPSLARADQCSFALLGSRARSLAMGGAAVGVGDWSEAPLVNPAALAGTRGFHIGIPSLNLDSFDGPSLSDINNKINDIARAGGGANNSNFKTLGQVFANHVPPSTFASSAFETLGYGPFALNGLGQARVDGNQYYGAVPASVSLLTPFGVTGTPDPTQPGASTVYHIRGGYAVGPNFAYGATLPRPLSTDRFGTLKAGVNLEVLRGKSIERYVLITRDAAGNVTDGKRVDHLVDPGSSTGVGASLGFLLQPHNPKLTYGLAIQNAVAPSIPGLNFQTQVTVGAAYHAMKHVLVAADIANLTGAYGQSADLRAGVEWTPIKWAALRAGASSRGVTFGAGIYGVNIAYSPANQRIQADILHF